MTPEEMKQEAWTWSFSKFKAFLECQERYRIAYFEGKIPPVSQRPFFQGSVAHKTMERAHEAMAKGEAPDLSKALTVYPEVFDQYAANIVWKDDMEVMLARQEGLDILNNYLALMEAHGLHEGEVHCEYWFGTHKDPLLMDNGLRWVGSIDWLKVDRNKNTALIYDAKTSKGTGYLDRRQLIMYAMAAERLLGVTVTDVGYLMLRWGKPIMHTVTQKDKDKLEMEMITASQLVEAQGLSANPSMGLCGSCQYSHKCAPFNNWIMDGGTSEDVEF